MTKTISAFRKAFTATGIIPKTATALYAYGLIATVSTVSQSYDYAPGTQANTDLQGFARNYSIVVLSIVVYLIILQRDYFFRLTKAGLSKFDERQTLVRQRIMERSYYFTIFLLAVSLYQLVSNKAAIIDRLQHSTASVWLWIPIHLLVLIIALPPIMATWRKDTHLEIETSSTFNVKKFLLFTWLAVLVLFVLQFIVTEINNLTSLTIYPSPIFDMLPFIGISIAAALTFLAVIGALLKALMGNK